jgi:tripartite-type tricarboxylate transporter receptor subunit TctC
MRILNNFGGRWAAAFTLLPPMLFAGAACGQDPSASSGQGYPVKPIRLIIPFVPGGANDVIGRIVGLKITEAHGQQVIIENRGGAGGSLGVEIAAKSPPDGYTLVLGNIANLAVNPTLYRKLGYHPLKDLQPITLIAKVPTILAVHPSLPARNVKELLALARAQPGQLTYGTGGAGSGSHLTMALFELQTKLQFTHVPYKGVGPALIDLLAGQITMSFGAVPGVLPYARSGRLRALGVSGPKRIVALPELPTIAEAGVPGFESTLWYGVLAPAGTAMPIVNRLHATLTRALQSADMKERFAAEGSEPIGSTPQEFQAFIKSEIERWAVVVKAAGMKVE